jgi:hypothetical protein
MMIMIGMLQVHWNRLIVVVNNRNQTRTANDDGIFGSGTAPVRTWAAVSLETDEGGFV